MKHPILLLLFSGLSFFSLSSMQLPFTTPDSSDLKIEISTSEDMRVSVSGQNLTGKPLSLRLRSKENTLKGFEYNFVIYSETQAATEVEVNRVLNLSKLESGLYELELKAGKARVTRKLEIRSLPQTPVEPQRTIVFE